jgi:hypothetical protein
MSISRVIRSFPVSALLLASNLFVPAVLAQTPQLIDPNALPACALNCALLNQAQAACLPPAAPVSNKAGYDACFCQSAYLQPFYSSPNGVCDAECASDTAALSQIQKWYTGLCKAAAAPEPPTTTVDPGATTTTSVAPLATTSAIDTSLGTVVQGPSGSWISRHWQWVIFIVVVFFAIVGLALLLRWLKKRHAARHSALTRGMAAADTRRSNHGNERGPNSSQPQMAMTPANGSQAAVGAAPAPSRQATRSLGTRGSFSVSKDSLGQMPFVALGGRSRSNSRPTSPPPVVWGPHQNQAHSRGFGYGDPGVDVPPPIPPMSATRSNRNSWGPHNPSNGAAVSGGPSREALREEEEEEEDKRPHAPGERESDLVDGVRRKLSKKRP